MAHYSLTLDASSLTTAARKLADLETGLGSGDEGGRLRRLSGSRGSWTGRAATACFAEMVRLGDAMIAVSAKAGSARAAVESFARAAETAMTATLPGLNRRWDAANTAYDSAVSRASATYRSEVRAVRNLAPEDQEEILDDAQRTRDRAIDSAAAARFRTRERLDAEYHDMITGLESAARALAAGLTAAMPIPFSDAEWSAVRGGAIPPGMRSALAARALGAQSFAQRAASREYAAQVAAELAADAAGHDPSRPVSADVLAALAQMGRDEDFVEVLMSTLGPGGAALLNWRVRRMFEDQFEPPNRERGQQLLNALTTVYGTASRVLIDTPAGPRPLLDAAWLARFNPSEAAALSEEFRMALRMSTMPEFLHGYRPDLLLPFPQAKGALSPEFSALVAQLALTDYEAFSNGSDENLRWLLYRGEDNLLGTSLRSYMEGDTSNPFRMDLLHVALDRASDYGSSANAVLLAHQKSVLGLMAGQDPMFSSAGVHDWLSGSLGTLLTQATIGYQKDEPGLADAALHAVANYLASHQGQHLLPPVQSALGTVIIDPRMMNGALMSVTSPFGDNQAGLPGVHTNWADPSAGPFMPTSLWAALHQEAMLQPKTAAAVIAAFGDFIDRQSDQAQHLGYLYNPTSGKFDIPNTGITSLQLFQAESARHFLATNLQADLDGLQKALEAELAKIGAQKEQAKQILGQFIDWARDPKSIVPDVTKKLTEFAIDAAVDWRFPSTSDIEGKYQSQLSALKASLDSAIVAPSVWTSITDVTDQLIRDMETGRGPATVVTPVGDGAHPGALTTNGSPTAYIGHVNIFDSSNPTRPITDDFLVRDDDGQPTGVMALDQMNSYQRQAYLNWLHDPAVQNYLAERTQALETAVRRATGR